MLEFCKRSDLCGNCAINAGGKKLFSSGDILTELYSSVLEVLSTHQLS